MGFFSRFMRSIRQRVGYIPGTSATSKAWSREVEDQDTCVAIMDCNAAHTAKGQVLHVVLDKEGRIEKIKRDSAYTRLFQRPNPMMSGYDFLYALSWQLDEKNTALAWIDWDGATPKTIWPIAYSQFAFREIVDGGFAVEFSDLDGEKHVLSLEDVVVLRRHFDGSGVAGRGNFPVYEVLGMAQAVDESLRDAATISNKIHGLLKAKKAMLSQKDVEKSQEEFRRRMEQAAQKGGIVTLDATEDYTPLNVTAWAANASQMQQVGDRLFAYWRVPREVVLNTASEQTMQNYYDSIIEPRWLAMGQAFTNALFTSREYASGNRMMMYGGAATGASWNTKLAIVTDTKEIGLLTTNEYRELLGWAPVADGDERFVSLNYIKAQDIHNYQTGETGGENNAI